MLILHHLPNTLKDLHKGAVFADSCKNVYIVVYDKIKRVMVGKKPQNKRIVNAKQLSNDYTFEVTELNCVILPYIFYNTEKYEQTKLK